MLTGSPSTCVFCFITIMFGLPEPRFSTHSAFRFYGLCAFEIKASHIILVLYVMLMHVYEGCTHVFGVCPCCLLSHSLCLSCVRWALLRRVWGCCGLTGWWFDLRSLSLRLAALSGCQDSKLCCCLIYAFLRKHMYYFMYCVCVCLWVCTCKKYQSQICS